MAEAMHTDALASLDADVPLRARLVEIHAAVRGHLVVFMPPMLCWHLILKNTWCLKNLWHLPRQIVRK